MARSEFLILFCLTNLGELTAQDVVDITGRPKNSVSRAVNAMINRGYVSRSVSQEDGRRAPLALTRAGRAVYNAALPLFTAREAALLATLTARERDVLDRLLAKLAIREDGWERVDTASGLGQSLEDDEE